MYEAELKFSNKNVPDLFRGNTTQEVLQIFRERLWRDSSDVYVTRIAAPIDVGGRLPVDPRDKEGYASSFLSQKKKEEQNSRQFEAAVTSLSSRCTLSFLLIHFPNSLSCTLPHPFRL